MCSNLVGLYYGHAKVTKLLSALNSENITEKKEILKLLAQDFVMIEEACLKPYRPVKSGGLCRCDIEDI